MHRYLAIIPFTSRLAEDCPFGSIDLVAECALHYTVSFCTWKIIPGAADEAVYLNTGQHREPT